MMAWLLQLWTSRGWRGRVAVLLAHGMSVNQIAAATGRKESTIRSHVKNMFAKHGLSRQGELVRLVQSLAGAPQASKAEEGRSGVLSFRTTKGRPRSLVHRMTIVVSPCRGMALKTTPARSSIRVPKPCNDRPPAVCLTARPGSMRSGKDRSPGRPERCRRSVKSVGKVIRSVTCPPDSISSWRDLRNGCNGRRPHRSRREPTTRPPRTVGMSISLRCRR